MMMKKRFYSLIILFAVELWPTLTLAATDVLTMGIFPRRNAKVTIKMFTPMARYLSTKTGKNIKLVTAKNFPVFWRNVMQGKYDIVHYNQLHYIESHQKLGYQVIAQNEEFGEKTIRSVLIVRTDGGIKSLKDLDGHTILFGGGKKAFVAYIVNAVMLYRAGLTKNNYTTRFAKNPPNATIATYIKQADAAGIGDVGLKIPILKKKGVNVSELKVISKSKPLPHIPWAVNPSMSDDLRLSIQKAMLSLNDSVEGKAILKKAGMTGIHKAVDKDYDNSRKIIKEFQLIR